jgi:hypothetical protein
MIANRSELERFLDVLFAVAPRARGEGEIFFSQKQHTNLVPSEALSNILGGVIRAEGKNPHHRRAVMSKKRNFFIQDELNSSPGIRPSDD